jgi:MFS family permease
MRTFLLALLAAVAGAILAFIGGDMATRAHGVSNMEGGRAMAVVFVIVPVGILVGIIVGVLVAKLAAVPAGAAGLAQAALLAILITSALAILVFGYSIWRAPRQPMINGQHLNLEFEVRMPEGRTAPASSNDFSVLVMSRGSGDDRHNADLMLDSASMSDGRVVIPARGYLYTSTTRRFLVVNDGADKHYWFDLPLRAKPRSEDERWTSWWPDAGKSATSDINGNGGFQIRYRVQRIPAE